MQTETLTTPENGLVQVDTRIKQGMKVFEAKKAQLQELVKTADGLEITSLDDKPGIEKVTILRKILKTERVQIEKDGKAMRDPLTQLGKSISAKEKELVAIIEPVEKSLQEKEAWVEGEKERIANELLQTRVEQLAVYSHTMDLVLLKSLTENEFSRQLDLVKRGWEMEQREKAEAEKVRLAAEEQMKKDLEELAQLRLAKEAAEKKMAAQEQQLKAAKVEKRLAVLTGLGFHPGAEETMVHDDFENLLVRISLKQEVEGLNDDQWGEIMAKVLDRINTEKNRQIRTENRVKGLMELGFKKIDEPGKERMWVQIAEKMIFSIDLMDLKTIDDVNWPGHVAAMMERVEREKQEMAEKAALEARTKERSEQVINLGMQFVLQRGAFVYPTDSEEDEIAITQADIETIDPSLWDGFMESAAEIIAALRKKVYQAEQDRLQALQAMAIEKALKAKEENDQLLKQAAEEKLNQASDKVKLLDLYNRIYDLPTEVQLKSKKAKSVFTVIQRYREEMLNTIKPAM